MTRGNTRRIGVLIASLMANCDSFEFIVSSDAVSIIGLLITRSSRVEVDGFVVCDDESGMMCRFRFNGTNPAPRQPSHMFLSMNAFGHALI